MTLYRYDVMTLKEPPAIRYAQTDAWLVVVGLCVERAVGGQAVIVRLLKEAIGVLSLYGDLLYGRIVYAKGHAVSLRVFVHRLVCAGSHRVVVLEASEQEQLPAFFF